MFDHSMAKNRIWEHSSYLKSRLRKEDSIKKIKRKVEDSAGEFKNEGVEYVERPNVARGDPCLLGSVGKTSDRNQKSPSGSKDSGSGWSTCSAGLCLLPPQPCKHS